MAFLYLSCFVGRCSLPRRIGYVPPLDSVLLAISFLGRTGVVIACYLIYAHRIKADKAIAFVRSKRCVTLPGSFSSFIAFCRPRAIQTRAQMQIVRDFADHIGPMWKIFPRRCQRVDSTNCEAKIQYCSLKSDERFSLAEHLRRQQAILHGLEARQYKHLPKVKEVRRYLSKEKIFLIDYRSPLSTRGCLDKGKSRHQRRR